MKRGWLNSSLLNGWRMKFSSTTRHGTSLVVEELESRCAPARLGTPVWDKEDTFAEVINLGTISRTRGVRRSASIGFPTDVDMYRLRVAAGTMIEITVRANSRFSDPFVRLFDARGNELAFDDDGPLPNQPPGFSSYLIYSIPSTGDYYIGVSGYGNTRYDPVNGTGDTDGVMGAYSLFVKATQAGQFNITLRFGSGLNPSQQQIFYQAARRWEQIIIGDVPNVVYQNQVVDDILIDARAVAIDGAGGILGQAGPDVLRSGSFLPVHGIMEFDTADLAQLEQDGQLRDVILHEMGHVLGFGTIWDLKGLLSGAGTSNPRFLGSQATRQYQIIFNTTETSVPVENTGGAGTADSHWRESVFKTELMTGYAEAPGTVMPLSKITAASMADLGYVVNLNAADPFSRPPLRSGGGGGSGGGSGPGAPLRIGGPAGWMSKQVTDIFQHPPLISADEFVPALGSSTESLHWPSSRARSER